MDVRVRERLVGALVLVAIIVLLVPAVLKGPASQRAEPLAQPAQSVEVLLDDSDALPGDDDLMPEPEPEPDPDPQVRVAADPSAVPASHPSTAPPPEAAKPPVASGSSENSAPPPAIRSLPAPPTGATSADTPAWAIQLGAFSTRDKAESLVADLRKRGYAAFVLEYRAAGKVLHRVRVGPEQDRARAVAIADRLRKDGFQPVVAAHP